MYSAGFFVALALARAVSVSGQTWCGKNYMSTSPIVPPSGQFVLPVSSPTPLLAFRCSPMIKPYLASDISKPAHVIVDARITFQHVAGAVPILLKPNAATSSLPLLKVSITNTANGKTLVSKSVRANSTGTQLQIDLSALGSPQKAPFNISCFATLDSQEFHASAALAYLPDPPLGTSVTKTDLRTGALLVNSGGGYEPIFPIGFYTQFDNYLGTGNLNILDELSQQGFTLVHPTPTFSSITALTAVLEHMQTLNPPLYLQYDMRWTYTSRSSVTSQVELIKSFPNLLLWYTADEPDGTSDDAGVGSADDPDVVGVRGSYDLIYDLDGGYHPVSLVLNCEDYFWSEYSNGADVLMQDAYTIGNNVTFSTQWGTPCTRDYGDCGCDNCIGAFEDISTRIEKFKERMWVNGWERTKSIWTVPQAFGNETYWKRYPTGPEFVIQSIVGINHGALGVVAWNDPTTPSIKSSASLLARFLSSTGARFILSPHASFRQQTIRRVDVGIWTLGSEVLVLAANMNHFAVNVEVDELDVDVGRTGGEWKQVLDSGASTKEQGRKSVELVFGEVGSGAWIVSTKSSLNVCLKPLQLLGPASHILIAWLEGISSPCCIAPVPPGPDLSSNLHE